ncbi:MAG: ATP-binding cassette domain-containing protein [Planctomycetales bacterium]|nr:ATP-binding cassette domain-containing protein [Planctomycetales bacterium]NIN78597.1 ATP-binding cassette domain-containing protein [Planctomycetales bacterium]NIO35791.1 ATP-binding cassette domain-containing protein [Planctomycetales bacterium]NIO47542.1 ATP-binding cassette domain-containing protein [Planctomycetales bacterium]NIP71079.1 ATP-binding cassette domain-containing protein [Planctomycetales bacterium]
MSTLKVENLAKQFPTRGEPLRVLSGIGLQLSSGENLAIVGPSGSGKSTLLHILGTLERPTSGSVTLDGTDPFQLDEPRLADFRNRRIGFVFQDHHLLSQCTVLENTLLPALARGRTTQQQVDEARDLLNRVGLADRIDHRPAELSGGERQRVAVARALINRPSLLLADEPTGNLDRTTAAMVAQLLLDLQRVQQTMLIVVTHSLDVARRMDQALELDDGRLRVIATL